MTGYRPSANRTVSRLLRRLGICLLASGLAWAGDPGALPEHQIKALYLFNFTKYVDWPSTTVTDANATFTIGVIGSDEVYADLLELTRGRTIKGRALSIKRIEGASDAKECQILYLARNDHGEINSILDAVRHVPVLTVGESEDFIDRGGLVHFAREENKLRLEINLEASHNVHLTISARLLPLMKVVPGHTGTSAESR